MTGDDMSAAVATRVLPIMIEIADRIWDCFDIEEDPCTINPDDNPLLHDEDDMISVGCAMMYMSPVEAFFLKTCWVISMLCFLYSSALLLEAILIYGIQRCQRQLRNWNSFASFKFKRI